MNYISNVFASGMLSKETINDECNCSMRKLTKEAAASVILDWAGDWSSCVGHPNVAKFLSEDLGIEIPMNRISVEATYGDLILVCQYVGPRLEEGATSLPEDASFEYQLWQIA